MIVKLTEQESFQAVMAGAMRQLIAIRRKSPEPYGTPKTDPWGIAIESCGAEMAVAKLLGMYWESVSAKASDANGDVSGLEVRSTPLANGRLIIHDRDRGDAPFILVRGRLPVYDVVGWMYGDVAKQERWLDPGDGGAGRTAYFVPDAYLRPMESLPLERGEHGRRDQRTA